MFIKSKNLITYCLDAKFFDIPNFTSMYLIKSSNGEFSIFDTGTPRNYLRLKKELFNLGVTKDNLTKIILSHVHMDHCGNSSLFLNDFPNSKIFVHPIGAENLQNPNFLIEQTKKVMPGPYFPEFGNYFQPINSNKIISTKDNMNIDKFFKIIHTPGHSFHHLALIISESNLALTGDAFGSRYDSLIPNSIFASTSPPTFHPDKFIESIEKILKENIDTVGLTHFGFHHDIQNQSEKTIKWIKIKNKAF